MVEDGNVCQLHQALAKDKGGALPCLRAHPVLPQSACDGTLGDWDVWILPLVLILYLCILVLILYLCILLCWP
ncbi:hypothetical protein Y032_0077g1095 [Ancylostoma ceylanicum]|nr:hypothetical protein Y032_0077g1095 [Ancylostoma ceylanicum]